MRFTDSELSLIKSTFADNDEGLKALRKLFLQKELTVAEQSLINFKGKKELLAVIRKAFLPEIEPDAPFHQVIDLWMTVDIKDKMPELALPHIESRAMLIAYLEQQLQVLEGNGNETIKFEDFTNFAGLDTQEIYVKLITRNTLIAHVEQQLMQFNVLAGLKSESVAETVSRLSKDSSK